LGVGSPADASALRTETMTFAECISLTEEIAGERGVTVANILRTNDVWLTRLDAADGSILITCSRQDRRLTLKRVPIPGSGSSVPEAAPAPAARG
jgi:hypothetical protein